VFVLTVRVPGEPVRVMPIDRPVMTLGRSSTNDLPIPDRTLSRSHARITVSGESAVLQDLDSRNGTMLNGVRIAEPVSLHPGDRIFLGETSIDFHVETTARVVLDAPERESPLEKTLFRSSADLVSSHRLEAPKILGAEELSRLNASLRILNEVSVELLSDIPIRRLLTLILDKIFAYMTPDRGLLLLADEQGVLKPEAVKFDPSVDPSDIRLSRTLLKAVVEERNGVLMIDTETDEKLGTVDSIRLQGITSCLAAPLVVGDKAIGLIYLDARLGKRSFTEEDLQLLSSLANTAAIKIQNTRLQLESVAKQRIEREMALAWEVQRRLLPDHPPDLPHSELFGRTIPSRTVSGDYYDFYERSRGRVDIVVADVCGKGMAASILAASVEAAFQAWAGEDFAPGKICVRLNEMVNRRTSPEKFVTFFAALYDPISGEVVFANAGHNPGLVLRGDGTAELLESQGLPLGLFPGREYPDTSLTLRAGDLLVLYTDGVTEAANPDEAEFGLERLTAVARAHQTAPLEDIETAINEELGRFAAGVPFADDRTLVLLRRS
jgi:serine phosphatase RsbU (regulator of sigma subunit)